MREESETLRWSEEDSQVFIDYGAYFVPERETQIETICSVISQVEQGALLVDLCCGEGLLANELAVRHPHCEIHALDGSASMLEATASKLCDRGVSFRTMEIDIHETGWREFSRPAHAVVSSLAVHHLEGTAKLALFRDMYEQIVSHGTLVICDLVEAQTDECRRLWERHWDRGVKERSIDLDGDDGMLHVFRKEEWNYYTDPDADPVDVPSPLYQQLKWLEEAGFDNIDVHWLRAGHAIFSGRRN